MTWINRILPARARSDENKQRSNVPEGLWKQCPRCSAVLYRPELERNLDVCSKCQHHLRISARKRIEIFLDAEDQVEIASALVPEDRLKFKDTKKYKDRLTSAQKATNEQDALVVVRGFLKGHPVVVGAFEFQFLGGSMGHIVGERFVKACEIALAERIPFVCFSSSGGARMQEAMISLMQMAKTSAALERLKQNGIPYISVLIDPVFGGVSASLAMLGDINIAEPNALVGFTGPNVIKQTIKVELPEGFQRSEFLLRHGAIDMIVERSDMRDCIARLLNKLMLRAPTLVSLIEAEPEDELSPEAVVDVVGEATGHSESVEPETSNELDTNAESSQSTPDTTNENTDQLSEIAAQSDVEAAQNQEDTSPDDSKKDESESVKAVTTTQDEPENNVEHDSDQNEKARSAPTPAS